MCRRYFGAHDYRHAHWRPSQPLERVRDGSNFERASCVSFVAKVPVSHLERQVEKSVAAKMVLESTIVCVDNSEYMRNGDFLPSRLHAQEDAVKVVCHSKRRSHPENDIALMTMSSPEVLASLTTDVERVLYLLTQLEPKGDINFAASLRVAHLMLKQRENKNHKMRIVFFVGSPVLAPTGELDLLARRLKREKVNVDIVNFGEYGVNMGKLSNFINILNGDATGSSHMVTVPAGNILSKVVASTPVVQGENSRRAINYDLEFEDDDPAVLLALRVSMAEQRQWQDYEARQAMADSPRDAVLAASDDTASEFLSAEEQQLLEEILFMGTEPGAFGGVAGLADPRTTSEDEQFDYDMLMSLQLDQPLPELISPIDLPDTLSAEADDDSIDRDEALQVLGQDLLGDDEYDEIFQDPAFMLSILASLPGVDTQSNVVQSALADITHGDQVTKPADKDKDAEDEHKPSEGK
ncbi:26S proteasome non-ATPase regulatory subunit 4 isoform X1 [Dermacentor silvarum]|uniref:26S proteasome non-ATPase regulatory subunit 4 isoform X1 n=1 Tax=Dermacentor silvarum TaxID=543639 RepID=UPI001897FC69|nr:26S proteasome non-ATPase regulatory subunit 4 isoform X1 [Dermacentor silvarum]